MYLQELKDSYEILVASTHESEEKLPQNTNIGNSVDKLMRHLDCAVIETSHKINKRAGYPAYDSVRGVFWEGKELYPGAGFTEKNHIQICVCNPNCIKGFFLPRDMDPHYPNP